MMEENSLLNLSALRMKPTWNENQWFFEMPEYYSSQIFDGIVSNFPSVVGLDTTNIEAWISLDREDVFVRFFIFAKGEFLSKELSTYIASLFPYETWGNVPYWSDGGNKDPHCQLDSPFSVFQISRYVSPAIFGWENFRKLGEEWKKLEQSEKQYYNELRNGRVKWENSYILDMVNK